MIAIRQSVPSDFAVILAIINEAAVAYRGNIPADRWHDPYMPAEHLASEIADGVSFWIAEDDGQIAGVMGIQDRGDVALVRHAYVVPRTQRSGIGTQLLNHVQSVTDKIVLIGTWASATWAIDFYKRNGFFLVAEPEREQLLRKYWAIPERQVHVSVVLADERWLRSRTK